MTGLIDLQKVHELAAAADARHFPGSSQPLAEALAVDLTSTGGSHLTWQVLEGNIELQLTVAGLMRKLEILEGAESVSPADESHLATWFNKLRKQIPENQRHLCFFESQNVELPAAAL